MTTDWKEHPCIYSDSCVLYGEMYHFCTTLKSNIIVVNGMYNILS